MKLILVRHGETDENARHVHQGHICSVLNNHGIEQAKKLALRLRDEKIDIVFSSDLPRCTMTAKEIVALHPGLKIKFSKSIREQAKCPYEGKPSKSEYPRVEELGIRYEEFDFDGGESLIDVKKRVAGFYSRLSKSCLDKNVLVVAHGGSIMQLMLYLFNEPQDDYVKYSPIPNASVSMVDTIPVPKLLLLNSVEHLKC